MGRSHRPKPLRLAEKLLYIRQNLGFTQEQLIKQLNYTKSSVYPSNISEFESGKREPPLELLLAYAELAGTYVDVLIDDSLDLPTKLLNRGGRERILKRFHRKG